MQKQPQKRCVSKAQKADIDLLMRRSMKTFIGDNQHIDMYPESSAIPTSEGSHKQTEMLIPHSVIIISKVRKHWEHCFFYFEAWGFWKIYLEN